MTQNCGRIVKVDCIDRNNGSKKSKVKSQKSKIKILRSRSIIRHRHAFYFLIFYFVRGDANTADVLLASNADGVLPVNDLNSLIKCDWSK